MVSFVIVSHSEKLAEGVADLADMMAKEVKVVTAGGMPDGSHGTSYEKIMSALKQAYSPDGVIVLMDMGSAIMTTEMVLEDFGKENAVMVDCPLVEGAVVGTVDASTGMPISQIVEDLKAI